MIRADYSDKKLIAEILANSFSDNKSVNYIIKQDEKRQQRLKILMEYSFDICYLFGDVFLSNDKKGCALIVLPDKKKTTPKSVLLDLKLIFSCVGLSNINKAISREGKIKKLQPKGLLYYLWFIGVDPAEQHKGVGSTLLQDVINEGLSKQRTVCLETSTLTNIPWYEKFGFEIYNELDLSYKLFFLKKN
ncbi:MAG TPA: GNAT family N-acetyltransferase [Parafilimonas sp.]|nr:GNAT family N-acetyltransferase [Parafilimonas sp.]